MQNTPSIRLTAFIVVIGVIAAALFIMMKPGTEPSVMEERDTDAPLMRSYDDTLSGLNFSYPDSYVLAEHDEGNAEREHHVIVLTDKKAAMHIPKDSEGPTTIAIEEFGNSADRLSVEKWIRTMSFSNFKLSSDQTLATSSVAGADGYTYTWDGLYRGQSTVIEHSGAILMFTVTYMDSTDRIRDDFRALISTVTLR